MDRWTRAGLAALVAGLALLAYTAGTIHWTTGDVVVRDVVTTDVDTPVLGPHHLSGGAYTFWLEDHPDLPGDTWRMLVYLIGDGDDPVDYLVEERRVRTFEGVRCFQVGDFDLVEEGDWLIELVSQGLYNSTPDELAFFVVTTFGMKVTLVLVAGVLLLILGAVLFVLKSVPTAGPRPFDGE